MTNTILWTEKVKLGRILDPLQISVLRSPEIHFLVGITGQTSRLRYYSFLTWAWKNIKEKNLIKSKRDKILDLEKIASLMAAKHHIEKNDQPTGIRNIQSAKDFLKSNENIRLDDFTSFGLHNRVGYGNYYYRGSLARLNIIGQKENEILVSPVANEIESTFKNSLKNSEEVFWKTSLKKTDLQTLEKSCICKVPKEEQKLWRYVFFGFTKPSPTGAEFDLKNLDTIMVHDPDKLNFDFLKLDEDKYVLDDKNILEDLIESNVFEKGNFASIMRTFSLMLILEIISQSRPLYDGYNINHIFRDSIYYQQTLQPDNSITKINFRKLQKFQKYWEVYVHNLYYISVFEKTFTVLLGIAKNNPLGITMDSIISKINYNKILKIINSFGINVKLDNSINDSIKEIENYFNGKKSNLNQKLNEHFLIQKIKESNEIEESFALIILLFLLCKYRFVTFDENSLRILKYKEHRHISIKPNMVYKDTENLSIKNFLGWLLEFVKKQHRLASAKKLVNSGTKGWLLTEEDGIIYFYGKDYRFDPFPEGKLYVVLELLIDLGLVEYIIENERTFFQITEEGQSWLKKLK